MRKAGYIQSKRGQRGGHMLAMAPEEITVGGIVRTLEGDHFLADCLHPDADCSSASECLTRRVWMAGSNALFERFDAITVAELVDFLGKGAKFERDCFGLSRCLLLDAPEDEDPAPVSPCAACRA